MKERMLYYVDKAGRRVGEVPCTRDREMSVSPIFYATKRPALVLLKAHIETDVQRGVEQLIEIEKELANL